MNLGYVFKNNTLLENALTHRSQAAETHNERLEFLGDAILSAVVATALFNNYPDLTEGQLSRFRAALVNRDALTRLAKKLDIGPALKLGRGEVVSGGRKRDSILSNTMEAIIGAIYLDGGINACTHCVLSWLEEPMQAVVQHKNACKDPKTLLQEHLQASKRPLPVYKILKTQGKVHDQTFYVSCTLPDASHQTMGKGFSRSRAEQAAAQAYLDDLESSHDH